jgi:hypothetical protein
MSTGVASISGNQYIIPSTNELANAGALLGSSSSFSSASSGSDTGIYAETLSQPTVYKVVRPPGYEDSAANDEDDDGGVHGEDYDDDDDDRGDDDLAHNLFPDSFTMDSMGNVHLNVNPDVSLNSLFDVIDVSEAEKGSIEYHVEKMTRANGGKPTPPAMMKMGVQLLEHQVSGVAWMMKMECDKLEGGILADDMGLGKVGLILILTVAICTS